MTANLLLWGLGVGPQPHGPAPAVIRWIDRFEDMMDRLQADHPEIDMSVVFG